MFLRVKDCDLIKRAAGAWLAAVSVFAAALGLATPVHAQETRAEEIAKKQAEKAAQAAPYTPNRFERIMDFVEQSFASPPNGFYPAFGSVYPGGGFTLGAGYRHFYARKAVWNITGLYSIRNYKQIEVGTHTPWNLAGRWTYGFRAGWRDAPEVGYYGLGTNSDQLDRANFRVKQAYGAIGGGFRPNGWTRLAGEVAYEDFTTEEGVGGHPSIETIYDSISAPGLGSSPAYIHSEGTAALDWRTSPGYSRRGGYYGVTFHDYTDLDETFSFQRVDGELIQHLPLLRENWVISLRGRIQTTVGDDDVVPYFLMPYLGSGSTLRAYSTGRFRDRHAVLTTAELRWIPNRLAFDMALFYDAGTVARRRDDLDFGDLKSNWGIGMRFHGPTATVLRLELADGSDGWNFVFSMNAAF
jgi:hypothetical protein